MVERVWLEDLDKDLRVGEDAAVDKMCLERFKVFLKQYNEWVEANKDRLEEESYKLEVVWATDPLVKWREGVTVVERKEKTTPSLSSSSKLLRPVMPLRKHGRSNRLASAIVNPRSDSTNGDSGGGGSLSPATIRDVKHREIVAYNDIL